MKITLILGIILLIVTISNSCCLGLFKSSRTNAEIVKEAYENDPVQKFIAMSFGDEIPDMRDDLIRRKSTGEGFFGRHLLAWSKPSNWKVDPNNDMKENTDPYESDEQI